ncbi:hypothetical protein REPUB_Repub01dG0254500 [Reevesia pubescens]
MAVIFDVNLTRNYEARLRFNHDGGAIHNGLLRVRDGDGISYEFRCRSEGGNWFCISGDKWTRFFRSNINAIVTLYEEHDDDDFYRIVVR